MKVKFVPQNVEFEIQPGQSVMHVAQDHNLYIKSVCKGVPSCAECRVRVVDGDHNVLPPGSEELSLIGSGHFIDRRRLSCQLKCFGDITIDMTEQIAKQQGLIGGQKKKKLAIKDDRIEDAHAIRADSSEEESNFGEGASAVNLESSESPEIAPKTAAHQGAGAPHARAVISPARSIQGAQLREPSPNRPGSAKTDQKPNVGRDQPRPQKGHPGGGQRVHPAQASRTAPSEAGGRHAISEASLAPQTAMTPEGERNPARRKRRRGGGGSGNRGGGIPQGGANGAPPRGGRKPPPNSTGNS